MSQTLTVLSYEPEYRRFPYTYILLSPVYSTIIIRLVAYLHAVDWIVMSFKQFFKRTRLDVPRSNRSICTARKDFKITKGDTIIICLVCIDVQVTTSASVHTTNIITICLILVTKCGHIVTLCLSNTAHHSDKERKN